MQTLLGTIDGFPFRNLLQALTPIPDLSYLGRRENRPLTLIRGRLIHILNNYVNI